MVEADLEEEGYRAFWEKLKGHTDRRPGTRQTSDRLPWEREKEETEEETEQQAPEDQGEFDRGQTFQLEAVMAAAESEDIRCTRDPVSYRAWHISAHGGWVVIWDAGNCWSNILEVDLRPEEAEAFWQRLEN